jgi:hypothetical protein
MRTYNKPPEGTQSIQSQRDREIGRWAAGELLDDTVLYVTFIRECADDEDFQALLEMKAEGLLSDNRVAPHIRTMCERYPKEIVGRLYRHIRVMPIGTARMDWERINPSQTYPCPDSPNSP